jgi:hypothetical protein
LDFRLECQGVARDVLVGIPTVLKKIVNEGVVLPRTNMRVAEILALEQAKEEPHVLYRRPATASLPR